jgi:hypothetical protein
VAGALGVPRRYAVEPLGTVGYSLAGAIFAIVFAVGFLVLLAEFASLGRDALRRRRTVRPAGLGGRPRIAGAAPEDPPELEPPLTTPVQIGAAVAVAVAGVFVFLPQIQEASEASAQFHHLAHSVQFLMGCALGAAIASTAAVWGRLNRRWSELGLAAVVVAPAVMLLMMIPGIYETLDEHPLLHAVFHGGVVMTGVVTGLGAGVLGRTTGRLLLVLSVGMALMYAAGVTGG